MVRAVGHADSDVMISAPSRASVLGGLGKGLVVADLHAHPSDRCVERFVLVAGAVAEVLPQRLVHLAVRAEHPVAVQRHRGVVPVGAVGLAEARG